MLNTEIIIKLKCDKCNDRIEDTICDEWDWVDLNDLTESLAERSDWFVDGDKAYCSKCKGDMAE